MEELIAYLNDKIEGCNELGMFNESWAFKQCLKKARSIQSLQTAVVGQSEQLCKHEDYAYTLNNDTKMCTVCFKTFV
jgi:hypothetical protein